MAEDEKVERVFLIRTPIKEFRCDEARAKGYAEAEAEHEDVILEVFEVTKTEDGEEFTQVGVADF